MPLLVRDEVEQRHQAGNSLAYLEHGLRAAERLCAHAYAHAHVLALGDLGELIAPHPGATSDEKAHLRALGSLYLLAQLEQASLVSAVEMLAAQTISGGIQADLGNAASHLLEFWRHRSERFSADERKALFDRIFDADFDNQMIDLCEALYKLDEGVLVPGASNPLQQAKVRSSAEQLAEQLLNHVTGESAFAADDILETTRTCTDILKTPQVEHAFGANTIWKTVEAILRRYGVSVPDFASLVMRGKAGLTILSWLADAHGVAQSSNTALVALDHPVIAAAVDWLESSLAIEQNKSNDATPPRSATATGGA